MDCRWTALAVLHVQHCRWSQKPQVVARTASAHKIDCLQLQHWQCLPHAHQHNILNILHSCQMAASRRASDPRPAPQLGSTPPPSSLRPSLQTSLQSHVSPRPAPCLKFAHITMCLAAHLPASARCMMKRLPTGSSGANPIIADKTMPSSPLVRLLVCSVEEGM
jgi:hypothetical protein